MQSSNFVPHKALQLESYRDFAIVTLLLLASNPPILFGLWIGIGVY